MNVKFGFVSYGKFLGFVPNECNQEDRIGRYIEVELSLGICLCNVGCSFYTDSCPDKWIAVRVANNSFNRRERYRNFLNFLGFALNDHRIFHQRVFKRLFFLKGPPPSEYYVDFNILQTKLKSLSLTQDMLSPTRLHASANP